ncbi:hypothetical protein FB45DRAFT_888898 [Roridomyces roridus]|uniref:F-box domain-containing protein n=1 Tax=Roridomyces roridus TaxID=1738132 RepID=A0AAD7CK36_9AGAR|nr:hypothetical protein FB45DRAFT_888898 [Roridomyces roridus]
MDDERVSHQLSQVDLHAGGESTLDDPDAATPISKIPYDVLLDIFHAVAEPGTFEVGRGALLAITHVCMDWRKVALDFPSLWSSFMVNIRETTSHLRLLELYLQRSRDAPLSVRIHARYREQHLDVAGSRAVLALLAQHSNRFFSLQLTGFWDGVEWFGIRGKLPHLEILQLPDSRIHETHQFDDVPRLHTLRTRGRCITLSGFPPARPWKRIPCAQIRFLVIWPQTMRDIPSHGLQLDDFPKLTSLRCILPCRDTNDDGAILSMWGTRSAPFLLPRLTSWCIEVDGPENTLRVPELGEMLDHFTTPALQSLDIIYLVHPTNLYSFLKRSNCGLTHLVLRRSSIRVGELLEILELLPALERLLIDNGFTPTMVTNKFFDNLVLSPGRRVLVPGLRELSIRGTYIFQGPKLLEMLQSRVGSNLKFVQLALPTRLVEGLDLLGMKALVGVCVLVARADKGAYIDL